MSDVGHQSGIDRRKFLTVLGASGGGALALSGCSTSRVEKLVPYLVQSEDQIPGVSTFYASTCTECAAGCGVHVRTREGRAVKLEGNPEHPVNQGKLCSRGQASLQGLYNPGRIRAPMLRGANGTFAEISWDDAIARVAGKVGEGVGKLAVVSGAGREALPTCWPTGLPRSAAGWCAGSRSITSPSARPTARCSASTSSRRTTSAARSTSSPSAPTSSSTWLSPTRTSAALPTPTGSPTETWRSSSTRAPGWTSPGSTPTNGWPFGPAPRRRSRWPLPGSWPPTAAPQRTWRRCWRSSRRPQPRRRPGSPPSGSSESRRSSRAPSRAWRWPAGSAPSMPARPSCVPRSTCSTSWPGTSARR